MAKQNKRTVQLFNTSTIQRVKAYAFTLAEVLIVIGIIGVVAALTLPNLNHATGDKEKVTKVKKIYSALTEGFDRAQAIYGPFDTWFNDLRNSDGSISNRATASERVAKRVTEFMKVSKDCGTNEGCFANAPLTDINGDVIDDIDNYLAYNQNFNRYMVILSDGISLSFDYAKIYVDIDGPNKGKNQEGSDLFDFIYYNNLLHPSCVEANNSTGDLNSESQIGNYVTAWVIENGNLDYLKCYDELNWETKTSCE